MYKLYNTQYDFATSFSLFLKNIFPSIRKSQLNIIPFIIFGMIISESVVSSDIAKSLKDDFSFVQLDSITRRFRRFFSNKFFDPYFFYHSIISFVISNYKKKHSDNKIHIIFDHMYSKEHYTILMFSLRIGKQSIPLYFRCFDGIRNKDAFLDSTIISAIDSVVSLFHGYNIIFLADRWFNSSSILKHIDSIGCTFCIRLKSTLKVSSFIPKEGHYVNQYTSNLKGIKYRGTYYKDVYLFDDSPFKTNIVISKYDGIDEPWIIATNGLVNRAIRDYSYRFGGIEPLFKNQKSNGFFLESVSTASLKAFSSLYSLVCLATLFLTILGTEYTKNTGCYKHIKLSTHKHYHSNKVRVMSLFNTGLTLFHLAFNSPRYIRIPFHFILYDI